MAVKRLPKGIKKRIREEKNRIKREILEVKEQKELVNKLYKKYDNKRDLQAGD